VRQVDAKVVVRLEGLSREENAVTSSGIQPATFRLIGVSQPPTLPGVSRPGRMTEQFLSRYNDGDSCF
jgi:hypothetical protein